jgi:hypothetical protein
MRQGQGEEEEKLPTSSGNYYLWTNGFTADSFFFFKKIYVATALPPSPLSFRRGGNTRVRSDMWRQNICGAKTEINAWLDGYVTVCW